MTTPGGRPSRLTAAWHFGKPQHETYESTVDLWPSPCALATGGARRRIAAQPARQRPSDQLATVVVTATKRRTLAQNTPISMTVLTAADIADRGLTDFNTLSQGIPGLAMRTSGPNQTEYEMRGLNSSGGNTSMVGVYLDEIALSAPPRSSSAR